jgi:hypothetical protein
MGPPKAYVDFISADRHPMDVGLKGADRHDRMEMVARWLCRYLIDGLPAPSRSRRPASQMGAP